MVAVAAAVFSVLLLLSLLLLLLLSSLLLLSLSSSSSLGCVSVALSAAFKLGWLLRKMVEKEMKAAKAPSETDAASSMLLADQGHPGANAVHIPKLKHAVYGIWPAQISIDFREPGVPIKEP